MKVCTECKKTKGLTEFFKDKSFKDGYYSRCKECKTKSTMKWRAENIEHYNASARAHNKRHYEKLRLHRYDLTEDQYKKMLADQNGICAIPGCNRTHTAKRKLCIDHDHATGAVRGLLCYGCNREMSIVDRPEKLARLIAYRDKDHSKKSA